MLSIARGIPLGQEPGLGALTVPGYLDEVTTSFAEREALAFPTASGVERWTYADLRERALELARALAACGVGKDSRVGILMTNRPELLAAAFGTALAGGVAVMLNTFATPRELAHMLEISGVSILLFERRVAGSDFVEMLCEMEPGVQGAGPLRSGRFPFLRRLAMLDPEAVSVSAGAIESWSDFLGRGDATPPALVRAAAATVKPADAGAIFFSSGTTSLPKGVLHAQRAIAIQWWRWGRLLDMRPPVRGWSPNAFFWSGNFAMVVGGTLSAGGALVLQPTFRPDEALALLQTERVSYAHAWPHQWAKLEALPGWASADLSALRYVGGETPAARHPTVRTSWPSPATYGATETLTISTGFPPAASPELVKGSHGLVLPGNTLKIVDPLSGEVLPCGERGELAVKGPTLMLGYLGVPRDESLDADGFFHSGDGGYLDEEGRFFWEGRLSDIVKTGGANVSPLEVDAVLREHPAVKVSQTVGVPHDTLGEMVVTCIIPHDGAAIDERTLQAFAKERLARYKVPRRVLFLAEDDLAKTGTDKLKTEHLIRLSIERLGAEETATRSGR